MRPLARPIGRRGLAHLSDEEVLKRMSRIEATCSYDPEIMLRNVEALRDEAAGFVPEGGA